MRNGIKINGLQLLVDGDLVYTFNDVDELIDFYIEAMDEARQVFEKELVERDSE